jgi:hypothetical protein
VNLQRRCTPATVDTLSEDVALTVVRETDAGIIVRGSRLLATLGPLPMSWPSIMPETIEWGRTRNTSRLPSPSLATRLV